MRERARACVFGCNDRVRLRVCSCVCLCSFWCVRARMYACLCERVCGFVRFRRIAIPRVCVASGAVRALPSYGGGLRYL